MAFFGMTTVLIMKLGAKIGRGFFSQIEGMSEIIRWSVVLTGAEYRTHENDDIISLSLTGYSDSQLVDCWHKHTETIEFASEDS